MEDGHPSRTIKKTKYTNQKIEKYYTNQRQENNTLYKVQLKVIMANRKTQFDNNNNNNLSRILGMNVPALFRFS